MNLRHHFEVDAKFIVVASLHELVKSGDLDKSVWLQALERFDIDPAKINPLYA